MDLFIISWHREDFAVLCTKCLVACYFAYAQALTVILTHLRWHLILLVQGKIIWLFGRMWYGVVCSNYMTSYHWERGRFGLWSPFPFPGIRILSEKSARHPPDLRSMVPRSLGLCFQSKAVLTRSSCGTMSSKWWKKSFDLFEFCVIITLWRNSHISLPSVIKSSFPGRTWFNFAIGWSRSRKLCGNRWMNLLKHANPVMTCNCPRVNVFFALHSERLNQSLVAMMICGIARRRTCPTRIRWNTEAIWVKANWDDIAKQYQIHLLTNQQSELL